MSAPSQLREAARRALGRLGAPEQRVSADAVDRIILSVRSGTAAELVSLALHGGEVGWSCTCSETSCVHAALALQWLAGDETAASVAARGDEGASDRRSLPPAALRTAEPGRLLDANLTAIADAVDDVLTAVVRAGVTANDSPSVEEMLGRLTAAMPTPLPLGVSRWVGRLRGVLAARDVTAIARLLDGARRVSDALRSSAPEPAERERIGAWLGATVGDAAAIERLQDRTYLEIARERVHGVERASIERRYLFELRTGEIVREERERGGAGASIGPCPRRIDVGLAEVERGVSPRRVRLMQYSVNTNVSKADWARVEETGVRHFHALAQTYRDVAQRNPATAEPFVVVAPSRIERDADGPVLIDDSGEPLPLSRADDMGAVEALGRWAADAKLTWVAGRLTDVDSTLLLVPCSVGLVVDGAAVVRRLT